MFTFVKAAANKSILFTNCTEKKIKTMGINFIFTLFLYNSNFQCRSELPCRNFRQCVTSKLVGIETLFPPFIT